MAKIAVLQVMYRRDDAQHSFVFDICVIL